MAEARNPTNDRIVSLLDHILRELEDVKKGQARLSADLDRLAKSVRG